MGGAIPETPHVGTTRRLGGMAPDRHRSAQPLHEHKHKGSPQRSPTGLLAKDGLPHVTPNPQRTSGAKDKDSKRTTGTSEGSLE